LDASVIGPYRANIVRNLEEIGTIREAISVKVVWLKFRQDGTLPICRRLGLGSNPRKL